MSLVMRDGTTASGRLLAVDGEVLVLDGVPAVPLAGVVRGKVEVEFNPPGAEEPDPDEPDPDAAEAPRTRTPLVGRPVTGPERVEIAPDQETRAST